MASSYSSQPNPWANIPIVGSLIDLIQTYLSTGINSDFMAAGTPVTAGSSGLLSAQPAASAMPNKFYYATDQAVLYFSDGTTWQRQGLPAGATTMMVGASAAAPTGWVRYDGGTLAGSTGIYASLYAHLGNSTALPDTRGRMLVDKGTHTDVSAVGNTEGVATVGNRRPRHRTTDALTVTSSLGINDPGHTHSLFFSSNTGSQTVLPYQSSQVGAYYNPLSSAPMSSVTTGITLTGSQASRGGSIGTNVATDPLDTSPYIVGLLIAKL